MSSEISAEENEARKELHNAIVKWYEVTEPDVIVTGWVVSAATSSFTNASSDEEVTGFSRVSADHMAWHSVYGLLQLTADDARAPESKKSIHTMPCHMIGFHAPRTSHHRRGPCDEDDDDVHM